MKHLCCCMCIDWPKLKDDTFCNRQTGKSCALEFGFCGASRGPAYCPLALGFGSLSTCCCAPTCLSLPGEPVISPRPQSVHLHLPPWPLCLYGGHLLTAGPDPGRNFSTTFGSRHARSFSHDGKSRKILETSASASAGGQCNMDSFSQVQQTKAMRHIACAQSRLCRLGCWWRESLLGSEELDVWRRLTPLQDTLPSSSHSLAPTTCQDTPDWSNGSSAEVPVCCEQVLFSHAKRRLQVCQDGLAAHMKRVDATPHGASRLQEQFGHLPWAARQGIVTVTAPSAWLS